MLIIVRMYIVRTCTYTLGLLDSFWKKYQRVSRLYIGMVPACLSESR